MNEWIARLRNAFTALAPREKLLVGSAGGLILLALLYVAVVNPLLGAIARTGSRREASEQELRVMTRLRQEYDGLQGRLSDVERRIQESPRGNLRSTLENLAREAQVAVESMEPQAAPPGDKYRESKVEVTLEQVNLSQTVNYLHQIESSKQVLSVKSLRLRKRPDNPELLDVTFTVSSFEPLQ
ncbi:MAG TPA: type II secretion system protein GspM [Myxococcota bacterium]|nr:type II secretion system protein GspM [Myxococcota bacterium]